MGYLDEDLFRQNRIEVNWMDYSAYPEYPQLYGPFDHYGSLLLNTWPDAGRYFQPSS